MENGLLTITELATKLGVDRKKIAYQATKLDDELVTKLKGVVYLKKAAIEVIVNNLEPKISNELDSNLVDFSSILVTEKDNQIEQLKLELINKDKQINELHKLLDQSQQLQANFQQSLNYQQQLVLELQSKKWYQFWK